MELGRFHLPGEPMEAAAQGPRGCGLCFVGRVLYSETGNNAQNNSDYTERWYSHQAYGKTYMYMIHFIWFEQPLPALQSLLSSLAVGPQLLRIWWQYSQAQRINHDWSFSGAELWRFYAAWSFCNWGVKFFLRKILFYKYKGRHNCDFLFRMK